MEHSGRLLGGIEVMSAVVSTGSFVRAGDVVGLTQSGVSRAIARLEHQVGFRLFERNARAVKLTEAGRQLYAQVAPLVDRLDEAVERAAGSAAAVRGRLRVNLDPFFAANVLAPRISTFLASHPDLEVELVIRDRVGNLISDGFDAAVRFGDPEPSVLVARRLLQTRIVTCASPAYLARHGRPLQPRDLANGAHRCILFRDPATGQPFAWEFHRGRRRLTVGVTGPVIVNDVATALGICLAGDGIAQLKELGTRDLLASNQLVALFPSWQDELFPLYIYHLSRHLLPAKVRAFVDFVVASTRPAAAAQPARAA